MTDRGTITDPEVECLKLKRAINENHRLAQLAAGEAVDRGILTGELLMQWKELLPHGRFASFVEAHFEGSARTSQVYMQAAKHVNALPNAQRTALLNQERSIAGLIGKDGKPGKKPHGDTPRAPRNGKDQPGDDIDAEEDDYGQCPNCAGTKWDDEDPDEVCCAKCHHPHGEPTGDVDVQRVENQRAKTVKTVEALMRAFDDLQLLSPYAAHDSAIRRCKELLTVAKGWT